MWRNVMMTLLVARDSLPLEYVIPDDAVCHTGTLGRAACIVSVPTNRMIRINKMNRECFITFSISGVTQNRMNLAYRHSGLSGISKNCS